MTVSIVEDDKVAMGLLKDLLASLGVEVVGVYDSAEEAMEALDAATLPNLVFMDIQLPGMSGLEATRALRKRFGETLDIVILTMFEDAGTIMEAMRAGISGYLLKGFSVGELQALLTEIERGGAFLSGKIARRILAEAVPAEPRPTTGRDFSLSEREKEILELLVEGLSYKEIAYSLSLSFHTVNNHLRKVYDKMKVGSRHEASAVWMRRQEP